MIDGMARDPRADILEDDFFPKPHIVGRDGSVWRNFDSMLVSFDTDPPK